MSAPTGHHRVSARHPVAKAICDRCGFAYDHPALTWQREWAGRSLINLQLLVCPTCLDDPNEQNRTIRIPADPKPVKHARPGNISDTRVEYLVADESGNSLTDESGNLLIRD